MIFIYLKGTLEFGLWFPKTKYFTLTTYTDADWDGSVDDKKSTSGGEFYLGKCLVSWLSKKQDIHITIYNRSKSTLLLHLVAHK
jgi:hypothetical protein